jgi:type III secretion system HrpB7-like protein
MSAIAIGKWRAIVAAKTRRCERIEQELARDRRALAERQAAFDAAQHARDEAGQRCAAHEEVIAALIEGAETLSGADYLRHDSWRAVLKEVLEDERKAVQKAAGALERHQAKVRETEAAFARAGAALDQCRAKLQTVRRAAAHAAELAADEEAVENLLARRYAR